MVVLLSSTLEEYWKITWLSRETYKINRTEVKQLPCRTPQLKLKSSEDLLLIWTLFSIRYIWGKPIIGRANDSKIIFKDSEKNFVIDGVQSCSEV